MTDNKKCVYSSGTCCSAAIPNFVIQMGRPLEPDMTTFERAGVCTLDCPDTCSLTVTVEADRIVKVRGSHALPYTDGVICNKVAHHTGEFVHGSGRLRTPLKRVGPRGSGRFECLSWEHALDAIHARVSAVIDRWGAQAVIPLNYAGPHGMLAYDSMSLRFFHRLGASQLFRGSMCGAVRNEAWAGTYGAVPGISPEAAAAAKLNVVWGNNATVTNLHLVRNIRASKRLGGRAPMCCWGSRSRSSSKRWARTTSLSSPST